MNITRIIAQWANRLPRSCKALVAIATLWCDSALTITGRPAWALFVGVIGLAVFLAAVPAAFRLRVEVANSLRKR